MVFVKKLRPLPSAVVMQNRALKVSFTVLKQKVDEFE